MHEWVKMTKVCRQTMEMEQYSMVELLIQIQIQTKTGLKQVIPTKIKKNEFLMTGIFCKMPFFVRTLC